MTLKRFLFWVLVGMAISCGSTDPDYALRRAIIEVSPYTYDIERDGEATDDRILTCAKEVAYSIPEYEIVDMDHDVVYVDCLEEGIIISLDDFVTIINNTNSNIALIHTND